MDIKGLNLGLRFVLELCLLAALGYWGFRVGSGPVLKAILERPGNRDVRSHFVATRQLEILAGITRDEWTARAAKTSSW